MFLSPDFAIDSLGAAYIIDLNTNGYMVSDGYFNLVQETEVAMRILGADGYPLTNNPEARAHMAAAIDGYCARSTVAPNCMVDKGARSAKPDLEEMLNETAHACGWEEISPSREGLLVDSYVEHMEETGLFVPTEMDFLSWDFVKSDEYLEWRVGHGYGTFPKVSTEQLADRAELDAQNEEKKASKVAMLKAKLKSEFDAHRDIVDAREVAEFGGAELAEAVAGGTKFIGAEEKEGKSVKRARAQLQENQRSQARAAATFGGTSKAVAVEDKSKQEEAGEGGDADDGNNLDGTVALIPSVPAQAQALREPLAATKRLVVKSRTMLVCLLILFFNLKV